MKTAIIYGPGDLRIEDVDTPDIGPDDVLVRVRASGICGSDVHRYLGTDYGRTYFKYPMNSGHEYCGDVVEAGNQVQLFREGDRATLGVSWTSGDLGAFSEYVHVRDADRRLYKLPRDMTYVDGSLVETFIVAIKSYHRPKPARDDQGDLLSLRQLAENDVPDRRPGCRLQLLRRPQATGKGVLDTTANHR